MGAVKSYPGLFMLADGRWRARKMRSGTAHSHVFGSREEALAWALAFDSAARSDGPVPDWREFDTAFGRPAAVVPVRLSQFLDRQEEVDRAMGQWTRWREYKYKRLRRVLPGRVMLQELTPVQVVAMVDELVASRLSTSVQAEILGFLRSLLERAVDEGLLARNPAKGIKAKPQPNPLRKLSGPQMVWKPSDVWSAIMCLNWRDRVPLLLVYAMGLRPGEVLGLRIGSVDLVEGVLTINAQGGGGLQGPDGTWVEFVRNAKTDTSTRALPLPRQLVDILDRFIVEVHGGPDPGVARSEWDETRMFVTVTGSPVQKGDLWSRWTRACARVGRTAEALGYYPNVKLLRKMSVTEKKRSGLHPQDVSAWHGHRTDKDPDGSAEVTRRAYTLPYESWAQDVRDATEKWLAASLPNVVEEVFWDGRDQGFITADEAAGRLGVDRAKLYRFVTDGHLTGVYARTVNGLDGVRQNDFVYSAADVDKLASRLSQVAGFVRASEMALLLGVPKDFVRVRITSGKIPTVTSPLRQDAKTKDRLISPETLNQWRELKAREEAEAVDSYTLSEVKRILQLRYKWVVAAVRSGQIVQLHHEFDRTVRYTKESVDAYARLLDSGPDPDDGEWMTIGLAAHLLRTSQRRLTEMAGRGIGLISVESGSTCVWVPNSVDLIDTPFAARVAAYVNAFAPPQRGRLEGLPPTANGSAPSKGAVAAAPPTAGEPK